MPRKYFIGGFITYENGLDNEIVNLKLVGYQNVSICNSDPAASEDFQCVVNAKSNSTMSIYTIYYAIKCVLMSI